jgi:hypothetical protein
MFTSARQRVGATFLARLHCRSPSNPTREIAEATRKMAAYPIRIAITENRQERKRKVAPIEVVEVHGASGPKVEGEIVDGLWADET